MPKWFVPAGFTIALASGVVLAVVGTANHHDGLIALGVIVALVTLIVLACKTTTNIPEEHHEHDHHVQPGTFPARQCPAHRFGPDAACYVNDLSVDAFNELVRPLRSNHNGLGRKLRDDP